MTAITKVTEDSFHSEILAGKGTTLLKLGAEWCSACAAQEPILQEVAAEMTGVVKVFAVDVDELPQIADAYGVRGLPTLLLFKDGQLFERLVGARSAGTLKAAIERLQR